MNENQVSNAETTEKVVPGSEVQFLAEARPIQKKYIHVNILYDYINQSTQEDCL